MSKLYEIKLYDVKVESGYTMSKLYEIKLYDVKVESGYTMSKLILKKHNYSQSLSNAFIQLYMWVYISLDIAFHVSLAF
jgi:hypothetical protein